MIAALWMFPIILVYLCPKQTLMTFRFLNFLPLVVTLDGRRYCGSFYSSAPVSPGAGDAPENCF